MPLTRYVHVSTSPGTWAKQVMEFFPTWLQLSLAFFGDGSPTIETWELIPALTFSYDSGGELTAEYVFVLAGLPDEANGSSARNWCENSGWNWSTVSNYTVTAGITVEIIALHLQQFVEVVFIPFLEHFTNGTAGAVNLVYDETAEGRLGFVALTYSVSEYGMALFVQNQLVTFNGEGIEIGEGFEYLQSVDVSKPSTSTLISEASAAGLLEIEQAIRDAASRSTAVEINDRGHVLLVESGEIIEDPEEP